MDRMSNFMAGPRPEPTFQPGEAFRPGEVWQSPRGFLYRVLERNEGTRQVVLRQRADGKGRKQYRTYDRVEGWTLITPA